MKFEITQPGVYGVNGMRIPVGTEIRIEGDAVPAWLANKGRVIGKTKGKTAVTNPAKDPVQQPASGAERQELLKLAASVIAVEAFLDDGRPDVRAINAELTGDAEPFTAEERDQLWPGIADAVKAERDA